MSGSLKRIGFGATLAMVLILAANVIYEPMRQRQAQADYKGLALSNGADLYAYYCAECHGAAGEGIGAYPALDQAFVRSREARDLLHTIAYGRYGTDMIAYVADFGGSLTMPQVDYLVRMLQHDEWEMVSARVATLGLMPEAIPITAAQNTSAALDYDQALGLFSTHCAECHGENGDGTFDAPQLRNAYVRSMTSDRLHTVVTEGVRNTNMAGFDMTLTDDEIHTLVLLLQNWDQSSGAEPITIQNISFEEGQTGFETWCAPCHGMRGEGGSIAPSLNDLPALPAEFITSRVRSGQNAMPPFAEGDLPDALLASIIAYAQRDIIGSGLPQFSAETLAGGEALYAQHCAECHGENGEGIPENGPVLVVVPPLRARTMMNFVRVGSAQTPGIPAEIVSNMELEQIIAYIHSLSE